MAAVVKPPRDREGRPSKSLTLEQAQALLQAVKDSRMDAYVVLSVMTGPVVLVWVPLWLDVSSV